jgi:hypothetical protein
VSQSHPEEPFDFAQGKFRDEESAFFRFGTQRGFYKSKEEKQNLFATAQDDAGAIFRICDTVAVTGEEGDRGWNGSNDEIKRRSAGFLTRGIGGQECPPST